MSKYTEEYIDKVLNRTQGDRTSSQYSSLEYIEGVLNRQKESPAAKAAGPLQIQQPESKPVEPEQTGNQEGENWLTKLFGGGKTEKDSVGKNQGNTVEKKTDVGTTTRQRTETSATTPVDWREKEKAAEQLQQELIRKASQGPGTWSTRKTESTEAYRNQYADRAGVLAEKSNTLEENLSSALEKTEQMGGSEAQRMLIDDELTNKAVNDLLEQTSVEDYLAADEWTDLERRAAIALLNRYRDQETNREAAKNYNSQSTEKKAELDQYAALEEKLGAGTTLANRLTNAAGSMAYSVLGTPDTIAQTATQAAGDFAANWNNEEWQDLGTQIVQLNNQIAIRQEVGGQDDPELQQLLARRAELEQQRAAIEQQTPLDQDSYGARAMAMSAELNRQGQEGLSKGGKVAYGVGYSVADNLAVAPLYFVPGGGGVALGIQGAIAGAQRMAELGERGIGAGETLVRGAVSGGIEAATEKIGMDNLVDIVGKGGKKALNSWVKGQLSSLAKSGGQSAAARVASAIVSNAGAEGLEEAASYIGNYAADQLFSDPESEFSVEELLSQAGMGALAGGIMGGGGAVMNSVSRSASSANGPQDAVQGGERNMSMGESTMVGPPETAAQGASTSAIDPLLEPLTVEAVAARIQAQQNTVAVAGMDPAQQQLLEKFAASKDLTVRYINDPQSPINGSIQGRTMTVNIGNGSYALGTAIHEVGHAMKAGDGKAFSEFQQAVLRLADADPSLQQKAAAIVDAYMDKNSPARNTMLNADGTINMDALNEEVALKLAEELVQDPEQLIRSLEKDSSLVERFLDFVRKIKNSVSIRFTGSQKAMLDEAERTLENMLRGQAREVSRQRLSIERDADGRPFVNITENILEGVPEKQKINAVKKVLRERFPEGFAWNGWKVHLTMQGLNEFTRSKYTQWLKTQPGKQIYNDKLRSAANLDEIIAIADNIRNETPRHERTDNLRSFNRADVRLRIGDRDYTAEVVTAIQPSTKEVFYDLVSLQPVTIETTKAPANQQVDSATASSEWAPLEGTTPIQGEQVPTFNLTQDSNAVNSHNK